MTPKEAQLKEENRRLRIENKKLFNAQKKVLERFGGDVESLHPMVLEKHVQLYVEKVFDMMRR